MREQVSGPGKNSKRTDMNVSAQPARYMSGGSYGEGEELMGLQQAQRMAGPSIDIVGGARGKSKPISRSMPITQLTAKTQRDNEPLSAGSDFGAGPGSEILNLPPKAGPKTIVQSVESLLAFDETGEVSAIYNYLNNINKGI